MTTKQPGPDAIMQLGLAFWGSKALLSAVELGLFTTLAGGPLTGEMLTARLGLQPRGTTDWLDALGALGLLTRARRQSATTPAAALYQDQARLRQFIMSLNMLIETPAGFDYTAADARSWMTDTGFRDTYTQPLPRPDSMIVGIK